MRPGQKNNRSRGRGNGGGGGGGRKNVNPLSRSYESNGPDVKVRGNPATIAEKYVQLARDAQASGDSVMAENYFQHAEHYFRIISAAQAQAQAQVRQQDERQKERAEQQNNDGAASERTDEARGETKAEPVADNADPEVVAQAENKQQTNDDEESAPRPRRAPRTRRPRRKPVENAELSEAPQPSINLGDAEAPKAEASNGDTPATGSVPATGDAPANDDAPAKTGGDDSTATEAAE